MTIDVRLPGLRAHTPMGLLVALGALDLLAEHNDPAARLSWCEDADGHCAAIRVGEATTPADVARIVFEAVAADSLVEILSLAPDLNKVTPDALHAALSRPSHSRVLCGLCAEAPLRARGQAAMTPLAIHSFRLSPVFGTLLRSDARLAEKHLRALFGGPWRYVPKVPTLNLDPAARQQDSARMAVDASADGTRGVRGALPLAARGLSLIPPLPVISGRGRRARVAAVQGGCLVWPVWSEPLTRFGVRALMGRAWGAIDSDLDATLAGCGVVAIYESEIVDAKDGRRLARARRRA